MNDILGFIIIPLLSIISNVLLFLIIAYFLNRLIFTIKHEIFSKKLLFIVSIFDGFIGFIQYSSQGSFFYYTFVYFQIWSSYHYTLGQGIFAYFLVGILFVFKCLLLNRMYSNSRYIVYSLITSLVMIMVGTLMLWNVTGLTNNSRDMKNLMPNNVNIPGVRLQQ